MINEEDYEWNSTDHGMTASGSRMEQDRKNTTDDEWTGKVGFGNKLKHIQTRKFKNTGIYGKYIEMQSS